MIYNVPTTNRCHCKNKKERVCLNFVTLQREKEICRPNLENQSIVKGSGERGAGVWSYVNLLNGFSTSVNSSPSFSYCLMKVYIRMQLLYIPNVIFLNTCLKEHILLGRKRHGSQEKERRFLPKCQKPGDSQTRNSCIHLRLSLNRT